MMQCKRQVCGDGSAVLWVIMLVQWVVLAAAAYNTSLACH